MSGPHSDCSSWTRIGIRVLKASDASHTDSVHMRSIAHLLIGRPRSSLSHARVPAPKLPCRRRPCPQPGSTLRHLSGRSVAEPSTRDPDPCVGVPSDLVTRTRNPPQDSLQPDSEPLRRGRTMPQATSSTARQTAPAAAKAARAVPRLTAVSPSRCPMAEGLSGRASHTCPATARVSLQSLGFDIGGLQRLTPLPCHSARELAESGLKACRASHTCPATARVSLQSLGF